jgi:hypothetical protein
VSCRGSPVVCSDRSAAYWLEKFSHCASAEGKNLILCGSAEVREATPSIFQSSCVGGLEVAKPKQGWSNVILPGKIRHYKQNFLLIIAVMNYYKLLQTRKH